MKVIIAGSRHLKDCIEEIIAAHIASGIVITEVVSGCAEGVDKSGEKYARMLDASIKQFPADWEKHGRAAGPIRNNQMAQYADALIAIWDGRSPGTKHMINAARKMGLLVYVYEIK